MITQEFNLNLIPSSAPVVVHVDQYDHGTGRLVASLYDGDTPYVPTNPSVYIQGTKPDGKYFISSTGVSIEGNVITADLIKTMTQVAGRTRTQFVVTEPTGRTGTFVFWLDVQETAMPDDSEISDTDISMIENAVETVQEAVIEAAEFAQASSDNKEDSEAWAKGTRNGEDVPSTDETYHNNAKYYAEQAAQAASHGGHTIKNENGTAMTARTNLQFANADVEDDAENDCTVVTPRGGTGGSKIVVTTSESSLHNKNVTISDGTTTVTEQFSTEGVATFTGITMTGTLTITSTDGAETATDTINVPYYGSYTKAISFVTFNATINISTASTQMQGQTVKVYKNGTQIDTTTFSAGGSATYTAHETGTYKFGCVVDGYEFKSADVVVSAETTYNTTIAYFGATLSITTSSSALYGKTITITKGGATVGTTAFSAQGSASYTVHETGTYKCSCVYGGETYESDDIVVSAETTYNATIDTTPASNVTITTDATVLEGETLTATNGVDTETATITNGVAEFNLAAGDWEVAGIPITVVSGQTYTKKIVVFAYHYSETDSNPASGDYPSGYDNYGWTPLSMDLASTGAPTYNSWNPTGANADKLAWFYPKSCMVKYDGTVDYYLDEDDETKKSDGVTASDVANSSYAGNAMIEWGQDGRRIYWKIVADSGNDGWTFIVANAEVLGLKPWNHYDINGNPNMHWYEAKYFGSSDGTRLRSISGGSNYVDNAGTTGISLAEANNQTSNKIWTTGVFCDYMFFALASTLVTKNLNCQAALGAGRSASGNTSAIGQGTMNGKGRFYGKSNGTEGVKVFGVENPYGNIWRRIRGLININGSYRIKMTYDQTDGSTTNGYNTDGSGYINAGSIGTTDTWVYPKHDIVRDNCLLAQTNGGSETTYYCDATYLAASGTSYAIVGGNLSGAGLDGLFAVALSSAVSRTDTYFGAALSLKPLAQ